MWTAEAWKASVNTRAPKGGDARTKLRVELLKVELEGLGAEIRRGHKGLVRCDMSICARDERVPSVPSFRSRTTRLKPSRSGTGTAVAAWRHCRKAFSWTDYQLSAAAAQQNGTLGSPSRGRRRVGVPTPTLQLNAVLVDVGRHGRVKKESVSGEVVVPLGEALGEFPRGATSGQPSHDGSRVYDLMDPELGERVGTVTLRLHGHRPNRGKYVRWSRGVGGLMWMMWMWMWMWVWMWMWMLVVMWMWMLVVIVIVIVIVVDGDCDCGGW